MTLRLTTNSADIPPAQIHDFLAHHAYWSRNIPLDVVRRMLANSLCLAFLRGEQVVAFGRVVTDKATFAYVADVFVLEAERGRGLGKRLVEAMIAHPELQGLRRWMLVTQDAHGLYEPFGFVTAPHPERLMYRSDFRGYPAAEVRV